MSHLSNNHSFFCQYAVSSPPCSRRDHTAERERADRRPTGSGTSGRINLLVVPLPIVDSVVHSGLHN